MTRLDSDPLPIPPTLVGDTVVAAVPPAKAKQEQQETYCIFSVSFFVVFDESHSTRVNAAEVDIISHLFFLVNVKFNGQFPK